MPYRKKIYKESGPIGTATLNRPNDRDLGCASWYLEDLVGRERAKNLWYQTPKMTAIAALEMGLGLLDGQGVPDEKSAKASSEYALESVFNARHGGVSSLACMARDRLLFGNWETKEHDARALLFAERRKLDASKFGH